MKKTIPCTLLAKNIQHSLSSVYKDPQLCEQYAWWILQALFKSSPATLIAHESVELDVTHETQLAQWIDQLTVQRMPIAYLLGWVPFGELVIHVKAPTLIPRPETEEWCLDLAEQLR